VPVVVLDLLAIAIVLGRMRIRHLVADIARARLLDVVGPGSGMNERRLRLVGRRDAGDPSRIA